MEAIGVFLYHERCKNNGTDQSFLSIYYIVCYMHKRTRWCVQNNIIYLSIWKDQQKCYFKEPVHWDHPNIPLTAFLIIFRFYYVINGTKFIPKESCVWWCVMRWWHHIKHVVSHDVLYLIIWLFSLRCYLPLLCFFLLNFLFYFRYTKLWWCDDREWWMHLML